MAQSRIQHAEHQCCTSELITVNLSDVGATSLTKPRSRIAQATGYLFALIPPVEVNISQPSDTGNATRCEALA